MKPDEIQSLVTVITRVLQSELKPWLVSFLVLYFASLIFAPGLIAYIKKRFTNRADAVDQPALTRQLAGIQEEIRLLARRQEIQFSYYFQEKARVLATTYGKLSSLHRLLKLAVVENLGTTECRPNFDECRTQLEETRHYLEDSKIFLTDDLVRQIESIFDKCREALLDSNVTRGPLNSNPDAIRLAVHDVVEAAGPKMRATLDVLAAEFRKHLSHNDQP